jgi:hypothetical protein
MKTDRFLRYLLIGIAVLALLAVGLYLARSGAHQAYGDESTPEGVLRNYILAVQKQDLERAYSYLSDATAGKPDLAAFQQSLFSSQRELLQTGVEIGAARINADGTAVVLATFVHNAEGIFYGPYNQVVSITLRREKDDWKITGIPYPYGDYGWYGGYYDKVEPAPVPVN